MPFETKDVGSDYQAAMEMIRRSGQQGVPVIASEEDVIVGFDQVRLARLAEKHGARKRPPLGVLGADAEEYLARHPEVGAEAKLPPDTKGVYVGAVRPDTVADRAGVQRGDVIVAFAGKRVRSMSELDKLVNALKAGDKASARVLRGGGDETLTLQF